MDTAYTLESVLGLKARALKAAAVDRVRGFSSGCLSYSQYGDISAL
jgi:hypothetical protein